MNEPESRVNLNSAGGVLPGNRSLEPAPHEPNETRTTSPAELSFELAFIRAQYAIRAAFAYLEEPQR